MIQERLLAWFDASHRDMPWRHTKDPYRILVAEVLLQRTRVVSGTPFYERFVSRFPTVQALAAASEDEVLQAWEGLGYYRRARHLHTAAKTIVRDYHGRVPSTATALGALPGIGPYTAGAVASIAFGEPVPAVDGNVTRVLARLFAVETDVTVQAGRSRIAELARELVPGRRPGAFNQALMELGATVCTPTRPSCPTCPLGELCLACQAGLQDSLPRTRAARPPKTVTVAFAFVRSRGRTLLVRRGDAGLLGGLWSLPGGEVPTGSDGRAMLRDLVAAQTGLHIDVREEVAQIAHTFSHRRWTGSVYRCVPVRRREPSAAARWLTPQETRAMPLVPAHRQILNELGSRRSLESFVEAAPARPKGRPYQ